MPAATQATSSERQVLSNIDVRAMLDRLDRMRLEVAKCQSANMPSGLLDADKARILDYVSDYRRYMEYAMALPIPDSPEASGRWSMTVPDDSEVPSPEAVENDDIAVILRQFEVYRLEMVESQSARLIQGFIPVPEGQPGDVARFRDGITRIENLVQYAADTQPSDRPESTPKAMPVTAGR